MANQKLQEVRVHDTSKYFMDQVAKTVEGMPDVISQCEAKRLTANLVIKGNEVLENCSKNWKQVDAAKFMMDIVRMVTLGLDAANDECYAIPYNNNKTKRVELQCMPSSRGLRKLVLQHSIGKKIIDFRCHSIREGDTFKLQKTPGDDKWVLDQVLFNDGNIKGYVTIIVFEDGTSQVMSHTLLDIEKRRKASKAPNSPAWKNWPEEMAHAKAIRRHAKQISIKLPEEREQALREIEEQTQEIKDIAPDVIELEELAEPIEVEEIEEPEVIKPEPQEIDALQTEIDTSWM